MMSNEEVCALLKVKPELLVTVKRRKLQYFGHIVRHSSLCKTVLEGRVEGKRGRGRPPRKWMDDIKLMSGLSAADCTASARERDVWSEISSQPQRR